LVCLTILGVILRHPNTTPNMASVSKAPLVWIDCEVNTSGRNV
jgi:hypothetical protein